VSSREHSSGAPTRRHAYRTLLSFAFRQWPALVAVLALGAAMSGLAALLPWPTKILIDYALGDVALPAQLGPALERVGLGATPAVLIFTAAATDAVAQKKKKKSKCKDGETTVLAEYKVEKGKNLDASIKASLTGKPGDAKKGIKWMTHRRLGNCIACHEVSDLAKRAKPDDPKSLKTFGYHGKIGPSLDGAADRYTEAELRMIVVDSKKAFPDANTIMPSFHQAKGMTRVIGDCKGHAILSGERVEDIVAYLKTLKDS